MQAKNVFLSFVCVCLSAHSICNANNGSCLRILLWAFWMHTKRTRETRNEISISKDYFVLRRLRLDAQKMLSSTVFSEFTLIAQRMDQTEMTVRFHNAKNQLDWTLNGTKWMIQSSMLQEEDACQGYPTTLYGHHSSRALWKHIAAQKLFYK